MSNTVFVRFENTNDILEFSVAVESDPYGDWYVWVVDNKSMDRKEFLIHLYDCYKSEIQNKVNDSYTGRHTILKINYFTEKKPSDYGKLALQFERSYASLENRKIRKFKGISVRRDQS